MKAKIICINVSSFVRPDGLQPFQTAFFDRGSVRCSHQYYGVSASSLRRIMRWQAATQLVSKRK